MNIKQKADKLPTPVNGCCHNKYNQFKTEIKTIFQYLQEHTATASMTSEATGIKQKNITRYKRDLENKGLLVEVERKDCELTGFKAFYLSTNPNIVEQIKRGNYE